MISVGFRFSFCFIVSLYFLLIFKALTCWLAWTLKFKWWLCWVWLCFHIYSILVLSLFLSLFFQWITNVWAIFVLNIWLITLLFSACLTLWTHWGQHKERSWLNDWLFCFEHALFLESSLLHFEKKKIPTFILWKLSGSFEIMVIKEMFF